MLNNKNNIFVKIMLCVVLAIVLTVGVTYAYFRANITGIESVSTISVGGATLAIKYEGSNSITAENVIPGWSAKKYFNVDVTNTAGKEISYDIKLVVENSNFVTPDTYDEAPPLAPSFLIFALFECDSADDKTCSTFLSDEEDIVAIQSGEQLVHTITTKTSGKKYYALSLGFPNLDAEQSQTGTDGNPLYFSGYVTLESGGEVYVPPFTTDSWGAIASNIKSGNTSRYKVGDEKEVAIEGFTNTQSKPTFTVRIANNSTPSECATEGFSQTACGFVVEFVDIVEERAMNSSNTNVGGWPATAMRTYLNGEFLAKLPSDLQSVIADTTVVSGHGSYDSSNFTSTDKVYLLSTKEVWVDGSSNAVSSIDTAYNSTRQLDYYANNNVATSNYSGAIKNYAESAAWWWLRAAYSNNANSFLIVDSNGYWYINYAIYTSGGVAPAFRIE